MNNWMNTATAALAGGSRLLSTGWNPAPAPAWNPEASPRALDCSFRGETNLPSDLTLRQITDPDQGTVTVELTREGQSWLGFGFGDRMVGSTVVVGLPGTGEVGKLFLGGRDPAAFELLDDATLQNASVQQNATHTVLRFTKPLVEQGETAVTEEGPQNIIVAAGSGNGFGFHEIYFPTVVEMDACLVVGDENEQAAPTFTPTQSPTFDADQELDCTLRRKLTLTSGVSIKEVTNPIDETVTVEMTYESNEGAWMGISLSSSGFMVGNTAVIGLPDEPVGPNNPAKYNLGGKSVSAVTPLPDDQQTLTNTNLVQNATHTVMTFTQPLIEAGQREISATEENTAIFAIGSGNSLSDGIHAIRASFSLQLTPCLAPGEVVDDGNFVDEVADIDDEIPNKGLWVLHGFCMTLGWGLLVPLAIGAALTRNLFPAGGLWFKIHRGLNAFALTCILLGFIIAVYAVQDVAAPGTSAGHFTNSRHMKLGLVIVIFGILQAASGFLRPHLPHTPSTKDETAAQDDDKNIPVQALDSDAEQSTDVEATTAQEPVAQEPKSLLRRTWEYQHRILGSLALILAWFNIDSGLGLFQERFQTSDVSAVFWTLLILLIAAIGGAAVYSKTGSRRRNA